MKSFNVPEQYRSPLITAIKNRRKYADKLKKDFSATKLSIGSLQFYIARHFGFCYGVENAIEIAFRAVAENPDKRVFLLSEMIHNPGVNADLLQLGVKFIMDTKGNMILNWNDLNEKDIVIIPAFGTTLELEKVLSSKGIEPTLYETTCPFVEKVWNRAEKIGKDGYTIVVHGKPMHEETRATFSHSQSNAPTVVVKDLKEAELLAQYIIGKKEANMFYEDFKNQYSEGFEINKDLQKIGVVNQTTMLASETQGIADYLKNVIVSFHQPSSISERFADTRDTLCYATNDNQTAVAAMLENQANFAIVIGGYNSSNTSHLVELCEEKLPTFYIKDEHCIQDLETISHFDFHRNLELTSPSPFIANESQSILITSGASCPDALVERVIKKIALITNNKDAFDQCYQSWI